MGQYPGEGSGNPLQRVPWVQEPGGLGHGAVKSRTRLRGERAGRHLTRGGGHPHLLTVRVFGRDPGPVRMQAELWHLSLA